MKIHSQIANSPDFSESRTFEGLERDAGGGGAEAGVYAAGAGGGRRGHNGGGGAAGDERGLPLPERVGAGRQPWRAAGGVAL
jgi:hypothetical protein